MPVEIIFFVNFAEILYIFTEQGIVMKRPYDYIRLDKAGYPFNHKYPPTNNSNVGFFHGYSNNAEDTFFYDFAVQRYDLRFSYEGNEYYFLSCEEYAAQCDETFTNEFCRYIDGNDVLERFTIEGIPLLNLIQYITDVEAI